MNRLFLFRVQIGCDAGDTPVMGQAECSIWTKSAGFCALYGHNALQVRCGQYDILTLNQ
jgi:hypothetical protein